MSANRHSYAQIGSGICAPASSPLKRGKFMLHLCDAVVLAARGASVTAQHVDWPKPTVFKMKAVPARTAQQVVLVERTDGPKVRPNTSRATPSEHIVKPRRNEGVTKDLH
jgi:hypothetical protein